MIDVTQRGLFLNYTGNIAFVFVKKKLLKKRILLLKLTLFLPLICGNLVQDCLVHKYTHKHMNKKKEQVTLFSVVRLGGPQSGTSNLNTF